MAVRGAPDSSGRIVQGTRIHVDGAYAGANSNGSFEEPYTTIQDGIDAGAAGDLVLIAPGAYVEDLVPEDLVDMEGAAPGAVVVTGTMTITDESMVIENMNFIDDGAGDAVLFTGVAADTVRFIMCEFESTATGQYALNCTNTAAAATVELEGCRALADVANANAVVSLASGTLTMRECDIAHASNIAESVELLGAAAATFTARDCTFTGTLAQEAAAVAPACTLTDVDIVVGAVSAVTVAATCTCTYLSGNVTSADAGDDALDGAGTVVIGEELHMLGTADAIGVTNVTTAGRALIQHGRYTEAAGAGVRAIALDPDMPSTSYTVIVTYQDTGTGAQASSNEIDTVAATGFNLTTQGNGVYHWLAIHD